MAAPSTAIATRLPGNLVFGAGGISGRFLYFEAWQATGSYPIHTVLEHSDSLWWAVSEPPLGAEPGVHAAWVDLTAAAAQAGAGFLSLPASDPQPALSDDTYDRTLLLWGEADHAQRLWLVEFHDGVDLDVTFRRFAAGDLPSPYRWISEVNTLQEVNTNTAQTNDVWFDRRRHRLYYWDANSAAFFYLQEAELIQARFADEDAAAHGVASASGNRAADAIGLHVEYGAAGESLLYTVTAYVPYTSISRRWVLYEEGINAGLVGLAGQAADLTDRVTVLEGSDSLYAADASFTLTTGVWQEITLLDDLPTLDHAELIFAYRFTASNPNITHSVSIADWQRLTAHNSTPVISQSFSWEDNVKTTFSGGNVRGVFYVARSDEANKLWIACTNVAFSGGSLHIHAKG